MVHARKRWQKKYGAFGTALPHFQARGAARCAQDPIGARTSFSYMGNPKWDFCFIFNLPFILVGFADSFWVVFADLPPMDDGRRRVLLSQF